MLWSWTEIPVEAFPAPNLSPCLQNDKWWEGKGEGQWEDLSKLWTSCVARKIRRKNRLISSRIFIWLKSFYSSSPLVFSWVRLRPSPYPKMSDQVSHCGYFDFFAVNGKDSLFPLPFLPCTWLLGSCPLCLQPGQPSHTDCFRLLWCTRQVHHLSRMSRDWFLMSRAICSKVSGWNELLDLEGIINGLSIILLGFQLSCCVLDSQLILNTTQFQIQTFVIVSVAAQIPWAWVNCNFQCGCVIHQTQTLRGSFLLHSQGCRLGSLKGRLKGWSCYTEVYKSFPIDFNRNRTEP